MHVCLYFVVKAMRYKFNWLWENLSSMHTTTQYTFHYHMIAVNTRYVTYRAGISVLKVTKAAFAVACFWVLSDIHMAWGWSLNGPISTGQSISWLYINHYTRLAGEVGHGCSCFVCYVEVEIAPTDAIWLFYFTCSTKLPLRGSPPPSPSTPIGVLVVLA